VRLAHCEWSAGMMVRWQEGIPQPHREKFVGGLGGKSQILGVRSQDLRMSIPIGVNAVRPIEVGGRSIFRHTSGPRGGRGRQAHIRPVLRRWCTQSATRSLYVGVIF